MHIHARSEVEQSESGAECCEAETVFLNSFFEQLSRTLSIAQCSRVFSRYLECSRVVSSCLKFSRVLSSVLDLSRVFSRFLKFSRDFSSFLEISRDFSSFLEVSRVFSSFLELSRAFLVFSRRPVAPREAWSSLFERQVAPQEAWSSLFERPSGTGRSRTGLWASFLEFSRILRQLCVFEATSGDASP